jgi:hypothetical protein
MDLICSVANCEQPAEIECICKLREKYFCAEHFMQHRKANPNTRHIAQDIWPKGEELNDICEMCNINVPTISCLCNSKLQLFCADCIGIHSKISGSHSLEPLEASSFLRQSNDISDYLNRKTRIEKFNSVINDGIDAVKNYKKMLKIYIERLHERLNEAYTQGNLDLDGVENSLSELKEKVAAARFTYNLDLSDPVNRLLLEDNYKEFTAKLQDLALFSVEISPVPVERTCELLVRITNFIPVLYQKEEQISKYLERNSSRMPESILKLFRNATENLPRKVERILGLDSYPALAEDLSTIIGSYPNLLCLDLSGNEIGVSGAKLLFSAIRSLSKLTEINIGGNHILDLGCECLCDSLPCLQSLENLFLYKNHLTEQSAKRLSEVLPTLQCLKLIALNQNTISDTGLEALCGVLKSVQTLEALGLQQNNLSAKSSRNVARIIEDLPKLSDLSLDDNNLGEQTALELLRVIPGVTQNLKLYVRNNNISEQLEERLKNNGNEKVLVAISYRVY